MTKPLLILLVWLGVIALAPIIAPHDPLATNPAQAYAPPRWEALFGQDALGRDVFSRTLHGGSRTLIAAGASTLIATGIGLAAGVIAGCGPRWIRTALTLVLDSLLAFPSLLLTLVLITLAGSGYLPVIIGIGLAQFPSFAKFTAVACRRILNADYVMAARSMGANPRRLIALHVIPNTAALLLTYAMIVAGYCVFQFGALSFLGLTGELGAPDWGAILYEARQAIRAAPWMGMGAGVGLMVTVLLLNLAADSLNQH